MTSPVAMFPRSSLARTRMLSLEIGYFGEDKEMTANFWEWISVRSPLFFSIKYSRPLPPGSEKYSLKSNVVSVSLAPRVIEGNGLMSAGPLFS